MYDISENLFEVAVSDLESVNILFNAQKYNIALFQLQQSIEKLIKSYGLRSNIIEKEDLSNKISHLPHKVFSRHYKNQIDELTKSKLPILIPEMIPPHHRGKNSKKETVDGLKNLLSKISNPDFEKIKKIDFDELEKFINEAKELEKEINFDDEKLFKAFKDDFIKTNKHFKEIFKDLDDKFIIEDIEESLLNPDEKVKIRVDNYKYRVKQNQKFLYIAFVWVNLSLITSPHEQSTRYPLLDLEENPNKIYTLDHPVIKYIPEFILMLKNSIDKYVDIKNELKPMHNTKIKPI